MEVNHENLVTSVLISLHFMETQVILMCWISGFRREADEDRALLGYYADSSGNFLPTLQDNLSVPSCRPYRRFRTTWNVGKELSILAA